MSVKKSSRTKIFPALRIWLLKFFLPSTAYYELFDKEELYEQFGVKEY
ncbi:hypothetical protein ACX8XP_15750 [Calditrichota bacterium LG25]